MRLMFFSHCFDQLYNQKSSFIMFPLAFSNFEIWREDKCAGIIRLTKILFWTLHYSACDGSVGACRLYVWSGNL